MHILVTNDDGVTAPGLLALAQAMRELGQVSVLAPDHNWSASGHVKTLDRPLRIKEVMLADGTPALTSDGAPSDCVSLVLLGFLPEKVDMVVSGINPNANVGHDVTYSGTVTAAMEAVIGGVPGVAVSLDSPDNHLSAIDYAAAAGIARQIVQATIENSLPHDVLLNVNVPYLPHDQIKGFRITRQGTRVYRSRLDSRQDPRGKPYYWIGGDAPTSIPEKGTDAGALAEGYVSITPLQLDLTAYNIVTSLGTWGLAVEHS
ncbi:MAG: 5'/3'-nucleotidase SurE [Thermoflexales bacterium]|nr:5'/3'-nucleotidase SurE [Thermoflexales bacterium]